MVRLTWKRAMATGLWLLAGAAGSVQAGVAVSPLKQEITVKPGESAKVVVTLTNRARGPYDRQQSAQLGLADVQATENGGLTFLPAGQTHHSASKWTSLGRTRVALEPGQSQEVECLIRPPASTPPGEYYTTVLVTMDTPGTAEGGVVVQYRIASGVFVTIPGRTFPKQAKIERCELLWPEIAEPAEAAAPSASRPSSASQPAVSLPKVSVLLRNTGRVRFDGSGRVRVLDPRSREIFAAPLTSKRPCVFGGDSRLFEATLTRALPAGRYAIKVEMDYGSTWSKARYQLPVEILPEQAAALGRLTRQYQAGQAPLEVDPEKISLTLRPGAMRSLGLGVRNVSDGPVRGSAQPGPADGQSSQAWLAVGPGQFQIAQAARKTVQVRVQVPSGTPAGTYTSAVLIQAGPEGSPLLERRVPVEIEVKAEK